MYSICIWFAVVIMRYFLAFICSSARLSWMCMIFRELKCYWISSKIHYFTLPAFKLRGVGFSHSGATVYYPVYYFSFCCSFEVLYQTSKCVKHILSVLSVCILYSALNINLTLTTVSQYCGIMQLHIYVLQ